MDACPTSGSVTVVMATIWANVGMAMPAAAIRSTSDADDTDLRVVAAGIDVVGVGGTE